MAAELSINPCADKNQSNGDRVEHYRGVRMMTIKKVLVATAAFAGVSVTAGAAGAAEFVTIGIGGVTGGFVVRAVLSAGS